MSKLLARLSTLARSDQGRKLFAQAKKVSSDPATRRKIDDARRRLAARGSARTRSR